MTFFIILIKVNHSFKQRFWRLFLVWPSGSCISKDIIFHEFQKPFSIWLWPHGTKLLLLSILQSLLSNNLKLLFELKGGQKVDNAEVVHILPILAYNCSWSTLRNVATLDFLNPEQKRVVHDHLALQEFYIMLQGLVNAELLLSRYSNLESKRALKLNKVKVLKSFSTFLYWLLKAIRDLLLLGSNVELIIR